MAKDVDLSSREWRDLIFEGRNKDYGAYVLRKNSDRRHNKSMIIVFIVIAVIIGLFLGFNALPDDFFAKKDAKDKASQEMVAFDQEQEEEKADEPEKMEIEEVQPEPEVLKEEVLNTVKMTEIAIVKDEDVKKEDEVKSQEDLQKDDRAAGNVDFDKGTDDRNVIREHKNEIVVEEKKPVEVKKVKEEVFRAVEQMPQFPGGDGALMQWLSKNIQYPTMAQENNIQGRVIIQFVVTKTGAIGQVKVVKSVDRDLDREAVRLVKRLPKFIPGKMNGQPVNVWYTLPVNFKLQ